MDTKQFLTFKIEDVIYAIDILDIESIERLGNITRVPKATKPTMGAMNLRGNIIPIISFRQKLGLDKGSLNDEMRIIVLESQDERVGLAVDRVLDVETLDLNDIYIEENNNAIYKRDFIKGVIKNDDGLLVTIIHAVKLMES